ncbi:MAG: DUF72 domain-containing protein [Akkermansiaceae bacterium]|nr:DUF72 domain-containing protein [Akkermansiaceae bacterium]NNM30976.1 DUF72 domain-containing protein [Akkermansiaceae bacterium]
MDSLALQPRLAALAAEGVYLGTSSWKYDGWFGQLYTPERYHYRGKVAKTRFERSCLEEYAEVFPTVCLDASYYRFPGAKYLDGLHGQVPTGFLFSHKVTDTITIKHFPRHKRHGEFAGKDNPHFLDARLFLSSFLKPLEPHRDKTGLLIFEFSRFYPRDYEHGREFVDDLDAFLGALPTGDWDFGVEVRNAGFLEQPYFECLAAHGVAHVYNQWQRMPSLAEQLALHPAGHGAAPVGARLLLKCGRDYEEAVDTFAPYDRVQEEQPEVRRAAADLVKAVRQPNPGRKTYVYVNNRLEGNALSTIAAILDLLGPS